MIVQCWDDGMQNPRYGATLALVIISSRRLYYLHNIISRKDTELVSRIFATQCENPLEGDFIKLIEGDLN